MMPSSRSLTSTRHGRPSLEILPDTRFVVFNGNEHEAQSIKLTGTVRLHTPEPMSILKPKVRLEGKRKISWWYMGGISAGEVVDKRVFWNLEQKLGIESAHKVKAGTIEWPFEFDLSPSMPESVEGLKETYIAYHIHASVSRPGWNAKDITAQEHIRIVRTLGHESMETTRSRVNADIWANKISYSISIPTDAIVFGTSVIADVELSPIKKGVRLGKVELRLVETVVKRIQASEVPDIRGDRSKTEETEVAKADMDFPEHSRVLYTDETIDDPVMADEMYRFKAVLPLPKSLNICRQDVDSHNINITHRFKLMVNIHNPEGHVSQLVCRLPVKLFISPNLPVDERNEVCSRVNGVSDAELNSNETAVIAPPEYGRHQLDQIFSDIDPTGFQSRAGSGPTTPAGPFAQSRRGSHDNVVSMNGVMAESETLTYHGSATPHLLHSRLTDLQENSSRQNGARRLGTAHDYGSAGGGQLSDNMSETPPARNGSYFPGSSGSASPHVSAALSRRTSSDRDVGVQAQDYDMDDLARVPSYGAALRTPGSVTPFTEGPPSYVEATSRPPSRSSSPIQRPGQVHVRSGDSSPRQSTVSAQSVRSASLAGPLTGTPIAVMRAHASTHEDESRLRMLRARN